MFPDKKVTSAPSEVSSNSIVASYHCESCHKELDRAMDLPPNNLTCEDCCNEQRRLDPNEEIRYEESLDPTEMIRNEKASDSDASPEEIAVSLGLSTHHCIYCDEEYTCSEGIIVCEEFFGKLLKMKDCKSELCNLQGTGNLNEEKKTKKKKKKRNLDPNACEFCRKNRMDVQKISNMVDLVRSVEMSENPPCEY